MKSFIAIGLAYCGIALGAVPGFDISHYQATPYKFKDAYSSGARFVIIKVSKSSQSSFLDDGGGMIGKMTTLTMRRLLRARLIRTLPSRRTTTARPRPA